MTKRIPKNVQFRAPKEPVANQPICPDRRIRLIDPVWVFGTVPSGFWQQPENRRNYLLWLGHKLGFRRMSDWYRLTYQDLVGPAARLSAADGLVLGLPWPLRAYRSVCPRRRYGFCMLTRRAPWIHTRQREPPAISMREHVAHIGGAADVATAPPRSCCTMSRKNSMGTSQTYLLTTSATPSPPPIQSVATPQRESRRRIA